MKATLDARQAARAAGDHPLQQSFRAAAAQLLEKYGTAAERKKKNKNHAVTADKAEEEGEEEEEVQEGDSESDAPEEGHTSSAAESSEAGEESSDANQEEEQESDSDSDDEDKQSGASSEGPKSPQSPVAQTERQTERHHSDRQTAHAEAQSSGLPHVTLNHEPAVGDVDDIPYTIAAPSSYAAFAQLVKGHSAGKLGLIIQRIRACNAIALATDNRRKLQASSLSLTCSCQLDVSVPVCQDVYYRVKPTLCRSSSVWVLSLSVGLVTYQRLRPTLSSSSTGVGSTSACLSACLPQCATTFIPTLAL